MITVCRKSVPKKQQISVFISDLTAYRQIFLPNSRIYSLFPFSGSPGIGSILREIPVQVLPTTDPDAECMGGSFSCDMLQGIAPGLIGSVRPYF